MKHIDNLHENFILIHEFFYPEEPLKQWVRDDESYTGNYHESFDSIMPVAEKCVKIAINNFLNEWIDSLEGSAGSFKITILYSEVVDFIIWYNKNKQSLTL
jgi:hypothetical protein